MNVPPPPLNSLRTRLLIGFGVPLALFVGVALASPNWATAIALLVVTVTSVVIAWRVAQSVTRPIDRLRRAAGLLVAGRFEMEPPTGPNEIAQLIVDFNQIGLSLAQSLSSLRRREEDYRQYIGGVAQLMWRTDADGEATGDLPAWRAFTGQLEEEVHGTGWLDAVHSDERDGVRARWRQAVASQALFEVECRLRSADGAYRWFACRGVPIVNPDGSVREWIGACTDETERKEREQLRREKGAAEAASRAKSELLARVSHELRTPLNAIIGMSRLLAAQRFGLLNAKQIDYVNDVIGSGEHLLELVNGVLDVSELGSGRMLLRSEGFDPAAAVESVVETLRPAAEPKDLEVRFEPPEGGEIAADPSRFKQVVYNLLSNAVKFTPPQGKVTVRCQWVERACPGAPAAPSAAAGALRVEVTDTGAGVAASDQERLWQEFGRSAASDGGAPEGVGLGLAVSRRLVERMGGAIWVRSAPGEGSTFGFVLPRRLPETEATAPAGADV